EHTLELLAGDRLPFGGAAGIAQQFEQARDREPGHTERARAAPRARDALHEIFEAVARLEELAALVGREEHRGFSSSGRRFLRRLVLRRRFLHRLGLLGRFLLGWDCCGRALLGRLCLGHGVMPPCENASSSSYAVRGRSSSGILEQFATHPALISM